jgi:hypothetical protein
MVDSVRHVRLSLDPLSRTTCQYFLSARPASSWHVTAYVCRNNKGGWGRESTLLRSWLVVCMMNPQGLNLHDPDQNSSSGAPTTALVSRPHPQTVHTPVAKEIKAHRKGRECWLSAVVGLSGLRGEGDDGLEEHRLIKRQQRRRLLEHCRPVFDQNR